METLLFTIFTISFLYLFIMPIYSIIKCILNHTMPKNIKLGLKKLGISFVIMIISTCIMNACYPSTFKSKDAEKEIKQSIIKEDSKEVQKNVAEKLNVKIKEELKINFLNVGQADCILLQQGNENMLIDAGNNDDEQTIKNYLQSVGVNEFKYVIGTHPHEDHIGSMDYIMNSFKVGKIYFPKANSKTKTFENLVNSVKNKGMQFTEPIPGETFNLGQAKCTILAPNGANYEDLNNYSIVLKVEFGNNSFLFTGDAEDISEKEMMNKGFDLKADVLKVGHHGSDSSTTREFLNAVNPKYAVISVGKGNDYGHPHKETINLLKEKDIKLYRTDECGTIVCTSDGTNITFDKNIGSYNYTEIKTEETKNNNDTSNEDKQKTNNNEEYNKIEGSNEKADKSQTKVYVTPKGKKYHTHGCRTIKGEYKEISLEEAIKQGYKSCKVCNPPTK